MQKHRTIIVWLAVVAVMPAVSISYAGQGDPTGACCYCDGCVVVTLADCNAIGGTYQGDGTSCTAFCTDEINMPDPNLRAVVEAALGGCLLTEFNLLSLTSLYIDELGIVDLTGLEYAMNLTHLSLVFHLITDISPLANLQNLVVLEMSYNLIADISPLVNLMGLIDLTLHHNQITDISPLANLTNLKWLNLSHNPITDISPLANLTNLTILSLTQNQITDISPLANLTNLKWIGMYQNQITDISPLANLTNLTSLGLDFNLITDISPLANLTNLTTLYLLSQNEITDISPLANLTNLTILGLDFNLITDISPLANLTNLTFLGLSENQIEDLAPIAHFENENLWLYVRNNPLNVASRWCHLPLLIEHSLAVDYTWHPAYDSCSPYCDSVNIQCPSIGPDEYANRTFVCRINECRSDGTGNSATGFVIASNGSASIVLTNAHFFHPTINLDDCLLWFNYECDECAAGLPSHMESFRIAQVLHSEPNLDYALVLVDGDPASTYGVAGLDLRNICNGVDIYGIHHGGSRPKGYGSGSVDQLVTGPGDIEYDMETFSGSSGMPIFRGDSHNVIALHHGGNSCDYGAGFPIADIVADALQHLGGYALNIVETDPGPGDNDCDGTIGILDLLMLLANWGACDPPCPPACPADLDGDCTVGILDLLALLANWG